MSSPIPPPPPDKGVVTPPWKPNVGASSPAIPSTAVIDATAATPGQSMGRDGRWVTIKLNALLLKPYLGPQIADKDPDGQWRLNCALCPWENYTEFMHNNHRVNGAMTPFSARNFDNLPNPVRSVSSSGIAEFYIFIMTDWHAPYNHFEVEVEDRSGHAARRKFDKKMRFRPGSGLLTADWV